jgi:hypothetical protein
MTAAQEASSIPQQLQLNGLSRECEADNYCKTIRKYIPRMDRKYVPETDRKDAREVWNGNKKKACTIHRK